MKITQVELAKLEPDPKNARKHGEKNLKAISDSLEEFGQRTPIVLQKKGDKLIIRKGNGTAEAAKRLGWEKLAAVVFEEDDVKAQAYAIADNRTGELAEWDDKVLAELLDGLASEVDVSKLGFDVDEFSSLMSLLEEPELQIGSREPGSTAPGLPQIPQASHVRMVQLFFNTENINAFLDHVEIIKERYGLENVTDAVFEVCRMEAERENDTP